MAKDNTALWIIGIIIVGALLYQYSGLFTIENNLKSLCTSSGGVWTEKVVCDTREGEICPAFYCKCNQGFTWSNNQCTKISNKDLCISSGGSWSDICTCPLNSVGFKEGFGCDYMSGFAEQTIIGGNSGRAPIWNIISSYWWVILIIIGGYFLLKKK